jgi:hypothetical protein
MNQAAIECGNITSLNNKKLNLNIIEGQFSLIHDLPSNDRLRIANEPDTVAFRHVAYFR